MRACEIAQHARFQNLECRTENRLSVCNQIFRIFRLIPSPSICLNLLSLYIDGRRAWYKYSSIEVTAALFAGFSIGVNPGELIDVLAGFACLDLYGDDL